MPEVEHAGEVERDVFGAVGLRQRPVERAGDRGSRQLYSMKLMIEDWSLRLWST